MECLRFAEHEALGRLLCKITVMTRERIVSALMGEEELHYSYNWTVVHPDQ